MIFGPMARRGLSQGRSGGLAGSRSLVPSAGCTAGWLPGSWPQTWSLPVSGRTPRICWTGLIQLTRWLPGDEFRLPRPWGGLDFPVLPAAALMPVEPERHGHLDGRVDVEMAVVDVDVPAEHRPHVP